MVESVVKVPSTATSDFDFLAFSFNGKHSWDDFGIYRISDGNRYNNNLMPTMQDITAETPGRDGMYYFGVTHKQRNFDISFAFNNLSETKVQEMKQWLNRKEIGELWFEEAPYKVYTAKVTGSAVIKILCSEEKEQRIYKGEGSVTFTAYWPYAHTPDKVKKLDNSEANGKLFSSYSNFANSDQWQVASGLIDGPETCIGENPGELPAPFVLKQDGFIPSGTVFTVGEAEITTGVDCYNLEWDSKIGLVIAGASITDVNKTQKKPIYTTSATHVAIPINNTIQNNQIKGIGETISEKITFREEATAGGGGDPWEFISENSETSIQENFELNNGNFDEYEFDEGVKSADFSGINLVQEISDRVGEGIRTQITTADGDRLTSISIFPDIEDEIPFIFKTDEQERYEESLIEIESDIKKEIQKTHILTNQKRYFLIPQSQIFQSVKVRAFDINIEISYDANDYYYYYKNISDSFTIEIDEDGDFTIDNARYVLSPTYTIEDVSPEDVVGHKLITIDFNTIEDGAIQTTVYSDAEGAIIKVNITNVTYVQEVSSNPTWQKTTGKLQTDTTTRQYKKKSVPITIFKTTVSTKHSYSFKQQGSSKKTIVTTKEEEKIGEGSWETISESTNTVTDTETLSPLKLEYHYWYY